jgi:hypothetical protein
MSISKWFSLLTVVGCLLGHGQMASAQQSRPDDEITHLAEHVYLFRHHFHQSIVITTPQGVIVTDPISSDAARWLKSALTTLTDQPVRYVVYSHHHDDHITGGAVFADTALFVSHVAARPKILAAADPNTPVPTLTFTDRMAIDLGGQHVELIYTGRNHSDNSLVVLLPQHKLLFAVDFIPVETVAYRTMSKRLPRRLDRLAQAGGTAGLRDLGSRPREDWQKGACADVPRLSRSSHHGGTRGIEEGLEPGRDQTDRSTAQVRPVANATPTGFRRMWRGCTGTSRSARHDREREKSGQRAPVPRSSAS